MVSDEAEPAVVELVVGPVVGSVVALVAVVEVDPPCVVVPVGAWEEEEVVLVPVDVGAVVADAAPEGEDVPATVVAVLTGPARRPLDSSSLSICCCTDATSAATA